MPEPTDIAAMLGSATPASGASPARGAEAGSPLAIDAQHLTRRFRSVAAVDDISLDVPTGQLFGLVGPDGAGKSTLIKMLATVLPPTSGDALVFGTSIVKRAHDIKSRIGYMSQKFSLYGDLTVQENLDFFAKLRGVPKAERASRAARLLEFAGLTEFVDRPAEFLSGGMKQKLALAATLIHEPDLIFLDEPTTGVDPVSRREFWRIISDLHSRGITVVVATPYMDEAERCGEIAFLEQGRILVRDTPAGLKARVPGRLFEVAVDDYQAAVRALGPLPGVLAADQYGELVRVVRGHETRRHALGEGRLHELQRGLVERRVALAHLGVPETHVEAGVEDAVVEELVVLGVEEGVEDRREPVPGVGDRPQLVAVALAVLLEQVVDQLDRHLLLGAEVVDEQTRRRVDELRDLGDRRALQALVLEHLVVGGEHLATADPGPLLTPHPPASSPARATVPAARSAAPD